MTGEPVNDAEREQLARLIGARALTCPCEAHRRMRSTQLQKIRGSR